MKDELIGLSGDGKERERYEKRRESRLNEIRALSYAEEKGAKNLIQKGLDDDFIIETIGLSLEEVKLLKKSKTSE